MDSRPPNLNDTSFGPARRKPQGLGLYQGMRRPESSLDLGRDSSSQAGHALTSYHVVERCGSITAVDHNAVRIRASLESSDRISDLAVIKLDAAASSVATFAPKGSIQRGAQVIVVGFPLQGVLASQANVTAGTISATAGIRGDARWFQITAPVQPGNSGGPVLDEWGRVIGLVVASLDAQTIFEIFGDIPENVNFAIGADLLRVFLRASSIQYSAGKGLGHTSSVARIGREAAEFTVFVECWR